MLSRVAVFPDFDCSPVNTLLLVLLRDIEAAGEIDETVSESTSTFSGYELCRYSVVALRSFDLCIVMKVASMRSDGTSELFEDSFPPE
jgi:hypothetical protein